MLISEIIFPAYFVYLLAIEEYLKLQMLHKALVLKTFELRPTISKQSLVKVVLALYIRAFWKMEWLYQLKFYPLHHTKE